MKVIGAGLPRTATLTQKVALEMLGFEPCYHMVNVLGNLDNRASLARGARGQERVGRHFRSIFRPRSTGRARSFTGTSWRLTRRPRYCSASVTARRGSAAWARPSGGSSTATC